MAQATDNYTTSRFHNLSNGALADALGRADAVLKGAEVECKALKEEFKRRSLTEAAGHNSSSPPLSKSAVGWTLKRSRNFSARRITASKLRRSPPSFALNPLSRSQQPPEPAIEMTWATDNPSHLGRFVPHRSNKIL